MNRNDRRGVTSAGLVARSISGASRPAEDAIETAERLARHLGLRLGEPVQGGSSGSLVLKAWSFDGSAVAVKIDDPARLCLAETEALAAVGVCPPLVHGALSADGAVSIWIDGATPERGMLLESTQQVAELLGRLVLTTPPQATSAFEDVVWGLLLATAGGHFRLAEASPIDIDALRRDSDVLIGTRHKSVLLHGDLTTNNVILTEARAWAVDPRPHLGPIEWDAATWCLWACWAGTINRHVDLLIAGVPGLDRDLLASAIRFQACAFLTYRAEVGLDLPPDVVAMTLFGYPTESGGERR